MGIDYRQLRNLTARELIRALLADGFHLDRQSGSHRQYRHPSDARRVTVSAHGSGDTFKVKTLKSMLEEQAQWSEGDLRRLGLLQ